MNAPATLSLQLRRAVRRVADDLGIPPHTLRTPRLARLSQGEMTVLASDIASSLAEQGGIGPEQAAQRLLAGMEVEAGILARVEVLPSGLLRFELPADWLPRSLSSLLEPGRLAPRASEAESGSIQIEFVSADPTGPLMPEHGRGAVIGDVLARLLAATGSPVTRESYVNDGGVQLGRIAMQLEEARRSSGLAARGYHARIIQSLSDAARLWELSAGTRAAELGRRGAAAIVLDHQDTLARLNVRMDRWQSEAELILAGRDEEVVRFLRESGAAYELDGATWLRSRDLGDTLDRALIRSNGRPSYLTGDLAYHFDKARRGFDRLINVWGPAHAGYVARTRAGMRALNVPDDALRFIVFGPVRVDGAGGDMGDARSGPTLDEVLAVAGPDAFRLSLITRPVAQAVDLEMDALSTRDQTSPSWAFSRCRSELRSRSNGVPPESEVLASCAGPARGILEQLVSFPEVVSCAAADLDVPLLGAAGMQLVRDLGHWTGSTAAQLQAPTVVMETVACAGLRVLDELQSILGLSER